MNIPSNLHYTKDHEWILIEGGEARVGITEFAQHELGDIVFVDIETIGKTLKQGDTFGTIEAVKTVSDLFLPMSGQVLEKNNALDSKPELINNDPYGDGWIIKIKVINPEEISNLLTAEAYQSLIGE
jgi:glycine cleavage system H protein